MVEVRRSTIVDAPIAEVWRLLRDFNGHDRWHPAVATSAIEGQEPVDAVGSVRRFKLSDGSELREQLLALSDKDFSFRYCILESPIPLMGYVATVRLKPVTDGERTFWEWRSEFHPPARRRDELVHLVAHEIYENGFAAIHKLFRGPSHRSVDVKTRSVERIPATSVVASGFDGRTQAIVLENYGGPEVLRLAEIGLPALGPDEVRIRHTAIGVNFIDIYCRTGYFDLLTPPGIPGMEAAGVVEAVGERAREFAVGDRVAYACPPVGAYCERRNMRTELLVRLPNDVSDEVAAACLLKGVTASFLLHEVHPVKAGEVVLIHAAAGGVGQFLTQWARLLGAVVIAVVSNQEKARLVAALGADHVIIPSQEDFAEATKRLTNNVGADVVFDAVGADSFARSLDALAARGHLVSFGQASGPIGSWDVGKLSGKSLTISRPNYGHYTDTKEKLSRNVARFFSMLRNGEIRVSAPQRYVLSRASDAHRDLESRRTTGSLILTP